MGFQYKYIKCVSNNFRSKCSERDLLTCYSTGVWLYGTEHKRMVRGRSHDCYYVDIPNHLYYISIDGGNVTGMYFYILKYDYTNYQSLIADFKNMVYNSYLRTGCSWHCFVGRAGTGRGLCINYKNLDEFFKDVISYFWASGFPYSSSLDLSKNIVTQFDSTVDPPFDHIELSREISEAALLNFVQEGPLHVKF